ncbi:hypothetical protein T458_05430 [Brevibacillus panacihumi W25]|uniref:Uncharacterized protein n=1 Tax=Brevibacillus panacihumi W25 TaxID=1408254 RepID=V6MJZ4_9BACL|nr:hypothetical protein [Brevibacillus panacihumi]EST55768.1 hypothetical protein T458_05430 [Brevibacillus panacihumi W25]
MTLTEWLGVGGFILGVINSAAHLYIQFLRKPKLDVEILDSCRIVSNEPGLAHLQVNLRLKAIHGPVYLRTATLQHDSIHATNLSAITPPNLTPQYTFNKEGEAYFNITHFLPLINQEPKDKIVDLITIWTDKEKEFIDIRDLKIEKDDAKSFTVLASILGPKTDTLLYEDFEVKDWKLELGYDKKKEIIKISGSKLVTQYV